MGKQINIERFYPHSIEQVWNAISTKEALSEWLMPTDFELEKGFEFSFRTKPQPGFNGIVKCRVIDVEVPRVLSYSWQGGPLKKPTIVRFELKPENGGTMLYFTHSGFEGLINEYIVRFILGRGWKDLLFRKIKSYLEQ
jgi:uncharacterized protein YndB with AHSA1/START domain